ncbi:hypothetical protein [Thaumasiovibrio subtropicus]|uniref:hypothetical protein n=1 Tax=Thaumasiovibrio subtropicus TaxID=1891207 RepID=UPI001C851E04|nr:hypothetical protein [Thaumasiovibrio subtropicus]
MTGINIKMKNKINHNFPMCVLALNSVLQHTKSLPMDKALIVYPLVYQKELLSYLSKKNNEVKSLDKLIINNPQWFSNFDEIFMTK